MKWDDIPESDRNAWARLPETRALRVRIREHAASCQLNIAMAAGESTEGRMRYLGGEWKALNDIASLLEDTSE